MSTAYDMTECPPKASNVASLCEASRSKDAFKRKRWHAADVLNVLMKTKTDEHLSSMQVHVLNAIVRLSSSRPYDGRPSSLSKTLSLEFIRENAFAGSTRTVSRAIQALERLGIIKVKRVTKDFKTRNTYTVDLDVLYMMMSEWGPNESLRRKNGAQKKASNPKPAPKRPSEKGRYSRLLAGCLVLANQVVNPRRAKQPTKMRQSLARRWSKQLVDIDEPTNEILMGLKHAGERVDAGEIHYWRAGYIRDELAAAREKRAARNKAKHTAQLNDIFTSISASMNANSLFNFDSQQNDEKRKQNASGRDEGCKHGNPQHLGFLSGGENECV
jgi:hypothetical protein